VLWFQKFTSAVKLKADFESRLEWKHQKECHLQWYKVSTSKYNNNNSIQLIYYCANLTARRPITKRAREEREIKTQHKYILMINNDNDDNSIQLIYYRANLTARRPITKR
jgi:hypothetical protein